MSFFISYNSFLLQVYFVLNGIPCYLLVTICMEYLFHHLIFSPHKLIDVKLVSYRHHIIESSLSPPLIFTSYFQVGDINVCHWSIYI